MANAYARVTVDTMISVQRNERFETQFGRTEPLSIMKCTRQTYGGYGYGRYCRVKAYQGSEC